MYVFLLEMYSSLQTSIVSNLRIVYERAGQSYIFTRLKMTCKLI